MDEKLIALIERELGVAEVGLTSPLDALGMDSLEFVFLMQAIEGEFGHRIPEEKWDALHTVGDIAALLDEATC